jgi:NAD(P)-dependent dehydrogenase (short-subunit alcohol dehydrogenase family)
VSALTPADQEFSGRVAFVTGGASGIGRAIASRLAAGGAAVTIADKNEDGARAAAAELAGLGARALAVGVDVSDPGSVTAAVEATMTAFGGCHLAVNNAGISPGGALTADCSAADWRRVMAVNLDGVFFSLRAELPAMLRSGGGAIVNLSSVMGSQGFAGGGAYVAAKHGVVGLTKTAGLEYAARGIRINAVGPGFIDTPLLEHINDATRRYLVGLHPAGRLGTADEVAELVAFLLSERASFIYGSYHLIDGGYCAR